MGKKRKQRILSFFICCMFFSLLCNSAFSSSWRRGGAWNEGDLDMQKNAVLFDEVDATPDNPPANKLKIYGKDDGSGTTKPYCLDSDGLESDLLTGGTGAPIDATYITQTANASLSNEQALTGLTDGLVKVNGTTGVLSTATADTDYDSSTTNEINTITTGDANVTAGLAITFADGGIVTTTESADTITITGTEADTLATVTGRGAISTETIDLGGATLEIPNSDDPDTTVTGQISFDTDKWLRVYDGTSQIGIPIYKTINFTVQDPENLQTHAERSTQSTLVWVNNTGMTFTITDIRAISDTDDYTFVLFKSASLTDVGTGNDVQLDSVACSTDGTSCYYVDISSGWDISTIETGKYLIFEDSSGSAETVQVHIEGYFGGDVA